MKTPPPAGRWGRSEDTDAQTQARSEGLWSPGDPPQTERHAPRTVRGWKKVFRANGNSDTKLG